MGKGLIHGTKHHKDNRSQSLNTPTKYPSWECKPDIADAQVYNEWIPQIVRLRAMKYDVQRQDIIYPEKTPFFNSSLKFENSWKLIKRF